MGVDGEVGGGFTAKDIVWGVIGKMGTAGGTGYAIEFGGDAIRALSIEGRMTVCNMAIEAGARAGMVAVDSATIEYVKGRPYAPTEEECPQTHHNSTAQFYPQRHVKNRDNPASEESYRNHSHCVLRIVHAVTESHKSRGNNL
mgnify:CR=1 FL=1